MVFTKEWKCCQAESSSAFAPGIKIKAVVAYKQAGGPLPLEGREALEAGSSHQEVVTRVTLDSLPTLLFISVASSKKMLITVKIREI